MLLEATPSVEATQELFGPIGHQLLRATTRLKIEGTQWMSSALNQSVWRKMITNI